MKEVVEPHLLVIFGATGDLTERKLLPAYYHVLEQIGQRGRGYVLGVSRSNWTDETFRETAREALTKKDLEGGSIWCDQCLFYQSLGETGDDYEGLKQRIEELEQVLGLPGNRVYYLALPPGAFKPTIDGLSRVGLNHSTGWTRLVIEKPFGHDLETAQALNNHVHRHFDESQVYRIDHYLGKQTVQNLLALRFANGLFESVWNRDRIERVDIMVAEDLGVGNRVGYYDRSGAVRDMIQNHLTQLFTLVAMEAPSSFEADAIRQEKIKVLRSVQPIHKDDVLFGQYAAGTVHGEAVPGYREEDEKVRNSNTETFAAIRLNLSNWRWQGVPFVLRTGKRLPERRTQITVTFRRAPVSIFQPYVRLHDLNANTLLIKLQPNEGFDLNFEVKTPREPFELATHQLKFRYEDVFGKMPDGYETLLLDTVTGDQTLFVHAEEVEASWRLYDPILENGFEPVLYEAGSRGPEFEGSGARG